MPSLAFKKEEKNRLTRISTNTANSLFVDRADAVPVATGDTFGGVDLRPFDLYGLSAPTAVKAPLHRFSAALRADNGTQDFTAMRTLHSCSSSA